MTTGRVQLALNVTDFDAAVRLYSDLFATEPSKRRPGYANFAIADPPLELDSAEDVAAAAQRFVDNGLRHSDHTIDRCCHAVQDKIWVDAPDVPLGAWEFYTVLADDPTEADTDTTSTCYSSTSTDN